MSDMGMKKDNIFEKLESQQWLYGSANDYPEVLAALRRAADVCHQINFMPPYEVDKRRVLLKELLGEISDTATVNPPFRCDFGFNIYIGQGSVINFNLTVLDEASVTIEDNVMIGPNCQLITITHALDEEQRVDGVMQARPIRICKGAWLAAGVTVLPGVTIGEGAVIGAGSVVTKSIPAGVLAVGNPCHVLRSIDDGDIVDGVTEM